MKVVDEYDEPGLLDLLGQSYLMEGDTKEAARWWRLSTDRDPDRVGPWIDLGRAALQDHRPQDALEPLGRAVALDGKQYRALQFLCSAYKMLGRSDEAARFRKQADEVRRAQEATAPPSGMGAMPGPSR